MSQFRELSAGLLEVAPDWRRIRFAGAAGLPFDRFRACHERAGEALSRRLPRESNGGNRTRIEPAGSR